MTQQQEALVSAFDTRTRLTEHADDCAAFFDVDFNHAVFEGTGAELVAELVTRALVTLFGVVGALS